MTQKGTQLSESEHKRLTKMIFDLSQKKAEAKMLEIQLQELEKEIHEVEFETLPDYMHELGITEIAFANGLSLQLNLFYKANLPKDEALRNRAFAWLRRCGHAELIKHEVTALFSSGGDKQARELVSELTREKIPFSEKESIHHATLTAFVKEQFEKGNVNMPLAAFGAFIGERVSIKIP